MASRLISAKNMATYFSAASRPPSLHSRSINNKLDCWLIDRTSLIATDSTPYYSCTIDRSLSFVLEYLNQWDRIAKTTWLELAIVTVGCSHSCRESGYI